MGSNSPISLAYREFAVIAPKILTPIAGMSDTARAETESHSVSCEICPHSEVAPLSDNNSFQLTHKLGGN